MHFCLEQSLGGVRILTNALLQADQEHYRESQGQGQQQDVLCHCGDRPPSTVICCQGAAGRTSLSHYCPAEGVRANGLLVQGESRQLRTDRSSASRPEPVT